MLFRSREIGGCSAIFRLPFKLFEKVNFGVLCLMVLFCPVAKAKKGLDSTFGPEFGSKTGARVDHMTNYMPESGGINGTCGKGGGGQGMDPCKHFLDDFLDGKVSDCVVAATQRKGGSSALYGCKTEVGILSNIFGKPVVVCFADIYASKESEGSVGTNKQIQRSKFDVATRANTTHGNAINNASGGMVSCNGRLPNTQNQNRDVKRDPEAQSPPAGGGSGGGSPEIGRAHV